MSRVFLLLLFLSSTVFQKLSYGVDNYKQKQESRQALFEANNRLIDEVKELQAELDSAVGTMYLFGAVTITAALAVAGGLKLGAFKKVSSRKFIKKNAHLILNIGTGIAGGTVGASTLITYLNYSQLEEFQMKLQDKKILLEESNRRILRSIKSE